MYACVRIPHVCLCECVFAVHAFANVSTYIRQQHMLPMSYSILLLSPADDDSECDMSTDILYGHTSGVAYTNTLHIIHVHIVYILSMNGKAMFCAYLPEIPHCVKSYWSACTTENHVESHTAWHSLMVRSLHTDILVSLARWAAFDIVNWTNIINTYYMCVYDSYRHITSSSTQSMHALEHNLIMHTLPDWWKLGLFTFNSRSMRCQFDVVHQSTFLKSITSSFRRIFSLHVRRWRFKLTA